MTTGTGRLAGKVALVTGAARGQGRAHAVRLAQEGADIIAVDIAGPLPSVPYASATPDDLAETVRQVEQLDRRIVGAQADTRDHAALQSAVDAGVARLGRLDVIIANAGISVIAPWDRITPQVFADTIDVNLTGTWNTVMAGAKYLVEAGGGSIVLVSSAAGLKVQPFMVPYTASKFAVRGMAKAFAVELAKHHIRVNSLHPTAVATAMAGDEVREQLGRALETDPRLAPMFDKLLPVDVARPEEIAETVLFLASDESRYFTAHEIAPDAGVSEF